MPPVAQAPGSRLVGLAWARPPRWLRCWPALGTAGCGVGRASPAAGARQIAAIVGSISPQTAATAIRDGLRRSDDPQRRVVRRRRRIAPAARSPGPMPIPARAARSAAWSKARQAGLVCRRFTTTRESFDGVALTGQPAWPAPATGRCWPSAPCDRLAARHWNFFLADRIYAASNHERSAAFQVGKHARSL